LLGGVVSQEQNIKPNQEIVLQFTNETVTSDEAQNAIATVKQQLQTLGVHDIQVTKYEGGQLKITYFSTTDITSIKQVLSKEKCLEFDDSNSPFQSPNKNSSITYNLDVYEIQNGYDSAFSLSGKLGLEQKADNDRLSNTNPFATNKTVDYSHLDQQVKVAYKFHKYSGVTIDHKSNKIPEVRAGPIAHGINNLS
jgi:preprotein translocase subunit SecD